MEYSKTLKESSLYNMLPSALQNHINSYQNRDVQTTYMHPLIIEQKSKRAIRRAMKSSIDRIRLPARINSPLIPYTDCIKFMINNGEEIQGRHLQNHHYFQLRKLNDLMLDIPFPEKVRKARVTFSIEELKNMSTLQYSKRTDIINLASISFAKRATNHDLSITALTEIESDVNPMLASPYLSFLTFIHRLRVFISRLQTSDQCRSEIILTDTEEAKIVLISEDTYLYYARCDSYEYYLIATPGHFRLYHSGSNLWICAPISYLDYMFSVADILNNLDILKQCKEYSWAKEFFTIMIKFAHKSVNHNDTVDFMKSLEGLLLNISDYDTSYAMNWEPMTQAAYDLWLLDQKMTSTSYDFGIVMAMIDGKRMTYPKESYLLNLIHQSKKQERVRIQELSSLHKLIYYAEVDTTSGIKKFLKRVHTPRQIDDEAVLQITRLAKQQFYISYLKKHKSPPNTEGDEKKLVLLSLYATRKDFSTLETFPLSWWDGITLFDCMDNTLTDDALEFAKDKGALKSSITMGPGDSRKELLQVIESENYRLKNFLEDAPFVPKPPRIVKTNSSEHKMDYKHPVRLMEKEREQKIEARLFANGELSNKHALSLIATKMKKALSYYDEQLMTPTDKRRKELLHRAAQELRKEDTYSLLLDIEGHNQSMQKRNTGELCEFIGNLFGERGWGTIPDYFSMISVYHYDEYDDEVTTSEGQLGGIEGWLNPLWTLHTLLMMKLMRIMTDLEIKSIMVYSDDVDALIKIPQATEATVQSMFKKVLDHCFKFGMIVKLSQTTLSKHRVTMLRQHYADGERADSTLKKLLSVSGANNPMIMSEELEVAGICSSIASALEMSNHSEACCFLKNYKLGLLLARLPHSILSHNEGQSHLSQENLPSKLAELLYHIKDETQLLNDMTESQLLDGFMNDVSSYLNLRKNNMSGNLISKFNIPIYEFTIGRERFADQADRLLYLQVYDKFIQDLLFYWIYMPVSVGGLGGSLHINLILSGHSSGFSKSLHYIHQWIINRCENKSFFLKYLEIMLSIDIEKECNVQESRILTSDWPSDMTITSAETSVNSAIESMVRVRTKNLEVKKLFALKDKGDDLKSDFLELFRKNFHPRIAQFYFENTSTHFIDLLISKIETSSGLLSFVRSLQRLRNSLTRRTIENIRRSAVIGRSSYGSFSDQTDTTDYLITRRSILFPKISFIEVDEILYDNRIRETNTMKYLINVRRSSPMHFEDGIRVYDSPHMGNEIRYKGELLDDDRLLGNKEEFLAAKVVAVTKWLIIKSTFDLRDYGTYKNTDCLKACNLSLSTLTGQSFLELMNYSPNETGGEILHRIPNVRFNTISYIRSEMNRSLEYVAEINQRSATTMGLVDSNINFDYLRYRLLLSNIIRSKYKGSVRLLTRYELYDFTGIKCVQFVTPEDTTYVTRGNYQAYGVVRGHNFSKLRFRYMASLYLSIENITDLALIPNEKETKSSLLVGEKLINDLIYRYARELDKNYMNSFPKYIDLRVWYPVLGKLFSITTGLQEMTSNQLMEYIKDKVQSIYNRKRVITTVHNTEKLKLTMQMSCISEISNLEGSDEEFITLVNSYLRLGTFNRESQPLNVRLARYQRYLSNYDDKKRKLCRSLLIEYLITFHFVTLVKDGELQFDYQSSIQEFIDSGFSFSAGILISPDLQIRTTILGTDYIGRIFVEEKMEILNTLAEISSSNSLTDMIVPVNLPNLKPQSQLDGAEILPRICSEINYEGKIIPHSAMKDINDIGPLLKFAHDCSTMGADPQTFFSHTGSDSLVAQYGLYKFMKGMFDLDKSSKICDLTGGRGDFAYAAGYLGLNSTTYSRQDTFTQLYYHPKVRFDKEYDIFNNESLKFCIDYDIIHIDVSFLGSDKRNILDLILLLEDMNKTYTIRLNSVLLMDYIDRLPEGSTIYDHYIIYPSNKTLRPYQVYLMGTPGVSCLDIEQTTFKKTEAFRAIALSYGHLLNPNNYEHRLFDYEPNSISLYLPNGSDLNETIIDIGMKSKYEEQAYYLNRYINEFEEEDMLVFSIEHIYKPERRVLELLTVDATRTTTSHYLEFTKADIGRVSEASLQYHVDHLRYMQNGNAHLILVEFQSAHPRLLEYFRTHHPLGLIRSRCNIMLGMQKFCEYELKSNRLYQNEQLLKYNSEISKNQTHHQKEVSNAIKLWILSASKGDATYGLKIAHRLLVSHGKGYESAKRVIKIMRLTGFLYEACLRTMHTGQLPITCIDSIEHGFNIREMQRARIKQSEVTAVTKTRGFNIDINELSFDDQDLVIHIEQMAMNMLENLSDPESDMFRVDDQGQLMFNLDISISNTISDYLEIHRDKDLTYIGRDDIMEDDWYDDDTIPHEDTG